MLPNGKKTQPGLRRWPYAIEKAFGVKMDERRSLVIENRGNPKAVLLTSANTSACRPEKEIQRVIGEESHQQGYGEAQLAPVDR